MLYTQPHNNITAEYSDGVVLVSDETGFLFSFIAVDERDADPVFIRNNFQEVLNLIYKDRINQGVLQ